MDTMYFTWLDKPVDVDKDLQLPQFFLVDTPKFDCSQNYTAGVHWHIIILITNSFCRLFYENRAAECSGLILITLRLGQSL